MGKRGWPQQGWLHCFFPPRPRAELDWQNGHGDGSQCDAAVSILPLLSLPYHTRTGQYTHPLASRLSRCKLLATWGLRPQGRRAQPRASLHRPALQPNSHQWRSAAHHVPSYKLPHSSDRQHGPRVRAPAAWPCRQSTRIATRGAWIIFCCLRSYRGDVPSPACTKLGFPAMPAHIILQCFQG